MNQPTTRRVYPNDPESIVYDMTFTTFHDDSRGYARWLDEHPDGYVLTAWSTNPLGGMIHRATCTHVTRLKSTASRKVCTTSLNDAVRYTWGATDVRRWFDCVVCRSLGER
jgi:hypothetical protein